MRRICGAFSAPPPLRLPRDTQTHTAAHATRRTRVPTHDKARMQGDARPSPTLLPTLVVEHAESAVSYYSEALDARVQRVEQSEGRAQHSVLETAYGLRLSIVEYFPGCVVDPLAPGGLVAGVFQYVRVPRGECDRAVGRMVGVGGTLVETPMDAGYGQRVGKVVDRYGVAWVFAHDL